MRWWLVALGVVVGGCGASSPLNPCARRTTLPADPPALMALTDQPVTVPMTLPLRISCPGGNPQATTVDTTIFGPRNERVDHEATAPTTSETEGWKTYMTLTPTRGGMYQFVARFEPSLGIFQRTVVVARDHGAQAPLVLPAPRTPCRKLAASGSDALLCLTSLGVLDVYRRGVLSQTEHALDFAAGDDDVWTWTADTLVLWGDDGSQLRVRRRVPLDPVVATQAVSAVTKRGLLLGAPGRVLSVRDVDERLEVERLEVDTPSPLVALGVGSNGTLTLGGGHSLCLSRPTGEGRTITRCQDVQAQVLAEERGGYWVTYPTTAWAWMELQTSGEVRSTLVPRWSPSLVEMAPVGSVPYFSYGGRPVVSALSDLSLDAYPNAELATVTVSTGSLWYQQRGGGSLLFRR